MTPPLPPSRSSFDKSSLQEVINRYGWAKNPQPQTGPPKSSTPVPKPANRTAPLPEQKQAAPVEARTEKTSEAEIGLRTDLEAARKKIEALSGELAEKEAQLDIVSQQCIELKERGDEFEKSAFKENGDLLKLKEQLSVKEAEVREAEKKISSLQIELQSGAGKSTQTAQLVLELEKKLREQEAKAQKESDVLLSRIGELSAQLTVEGGVSVQDALAKYKQQSKQGAELLKQSMAEVQRLEAEWKTAQLRVSALEKEKNDLVNQLAVKDSEAKPSAAMEEKIRQLEGQVVDLEKRLHDAEAHAANSQAAVSHAMDFAYKATQDNELMKKKLHEAGIRI